MVSDSRRKPLFYQTALITSIARKITIRIPNTQNIGVELSHSHCIIFFLLLFSLVANTAINKIQKIAAHSISIVMQIFINVYIIPILVCEHA